MLGTFPDADGAAHVTGGVVVIGLGNRYRRDDGVGIVIATALNELVLAGVRVVTDIVEPMSLIEAWSGAGLAVVIDAAAVTPSAPGRVRRCTLSDVADAAEGLSSHDLDLAPTYALGQALDRVPDELVIFTVEVADTTDGVGLTPQVAVAVPQVVGMAADEISRARRQLGSGSGRAYWRGGEDY